MSDNVPTETSSTDLSQGLVVKNSMDNVGEGSFASNMIQVTGLKAPVTASFTFSSTTPMDERAAGICLNGAPVRLQSYSSGNWNASISLKNGDTFYLVLPYVAWGNESATFNIDTNGIQTSWSVGTKNYAQFGGHNCEIAGSGSGSTCTGAVIATVAAAPSWAAKIDPSNWADPGGCLDLAQQNPAVKCVLLPGDSGGPNPTTCTYYSGPPVVSNSTTANNNLQAANCP